jgi:hypothetical protein
MNYQLYKTVSGQDGVIKANDDGSITSFIFDPDNTDYQQYLAWIAEGNEPLPAENE